MVWQHSYLWIVLLASCLTPISARTDNQRLRSSRPIRDALPPRVGPGGPARDPSTLAIYTHTSPHDNAPSPEELWTR